MRDAAISGPEDAHLSASIGTTMRKTATTRFAGDRTRTYRERIVKVSARADGAPIRPQLPIAYPVVRRIAGR